MRVVGGKRKVKVQMKNEREKKEWREVRQRVSSSLMSNVIRKWKVEKERKARMRVGEKSKAE